MVRNMLTDLLEFILTVMFFLLAFLIITSPFVGGLLYLMNWGSQLNCYSRWEGSKYEVRYSFWGGCNVKVNGTWLPESSMKVLQ